MPTFLHTSLDTLLAPWAHLLDALPPSATSDNPCGPDLEYDAQYLELFIKLIPKEKKVVGGEAGSEKLESELEPLRWTEIEQDCLALMQRTRDARLAAVFTRCRVQQAGWQGLLEGLALLLTLLRAFPDSLHPALTLPGDESGERDVLPRADALSALADQEGLLSDIRALPLDDAGRLRVQMRDVERALTRPHPDNVLPPDAARRMLTDMRQRGAAHCLALLDALELTQAIAREAKKHLAEADADMMAEALRLRPLLDLLQPVAKAAQGTGSGAGQGAGGNDAQSGGEAGDTGGAENALTEGGNGVSGMSGHGGAYAAGGMQVAASAAAAYAQAAAPQGILHRNEARQRIREARLWFEEHEPSSPVSLLLRKAEQLVGKRFAEVVETLPLELLEKWEQEQ